MLNRTSGAVLLRTILPGLMLSLVCSSQVNATTKLSLTKNTTLQSRRSVYDAIDQVRQMALKLANRDRAEQGLAPLTEDPLLSGAAELHAIDMARRNYFDHYSPNGQGPTERFAALGGSSGVAENIIYTYTQGSYKRINNQVLADFQQRWMNSPGHRKNLMNSRYNHFGFGIAVSPDGNRIYAVQTFTP